MRSQFQRGFSLLESLLVLMVFAVSLGLITKLFSEYSRVARQVESRQDWDKTRLAVQRMSEEIYEALTVKVSDHNISFQKIDPSSHLKRRDLTLDPVQSFDPYGKGFQVTVGYYLKDRELVRTLVPTYGVPASSTMTGDIEALTFSKKDDVIVIRVTAQTGFKKESADFWVETL